MSAALRTGNGKGTQPMAPAQLKAAPTAAKPPAGGMITAVELITPAQAAEFLKLNRTNRPLRQSWIRALADIIARGEWRVTHQGVAITKENELLDGQHRLNAIVLCGVSVEMNVSYDCDPATFQVIDSGIKRTSADHLRVSPMTAAVARLLWRLPAPRLGRSATSQQLAEVLTWAQPLVIELQEIARTKTTRTGANVQMPLAVHLMAGRREVVPKFAAFVAMDKDNMPPSIWSLVQQMTDKKASASRDQWDFACRVWRAFDPTNWDQKRVILKSTDVALDEMNRVVEAYKRAVASGKAVRA